MSNSRRASAIVAGLAIAAIGLVGCGSAQVTPTPPAQPTQAPTNAPGTQPAATPTIQATPMATASEPQAATPTPNATATPKPTSASTPTPEVTPTPEATPTASPTSVAWQCTGTAEHQAFFVTAASKLPFDVYCAVLPNGWYFQDANYAQPAGGKLTVNYKGPGGATLGISEGAFCTTGVSQCSPHISIRGTAAFGDLPGMLDILTSPPDVLVIYVNPGTAKAYSITGGNLTQAKFVALAAALVKVPKG